MYFYFETEKTISPLLCRINYWHLSASLLFMQIGCLGKLFNYLRCLSHKVESMVYSQLSLNAEHCFDFKRTSLVKKKILPFINRKGKT